MVSHEKVIMISIISLATLNLLVAPIIDGESGDFNLPLTDPPEGTLLSGEYESPNNTGWTGAVINIATYVGDFVGTGFWLIGALGETIFAGSFVSPILSVANILISIIALITLWRLIRGN